VARQVAVARARPARLAAFEEPARTRANLRALAGDDPRAARAAITARLTAQCWSAWREELRRAGMRKADLAAIVESDRAETWHWVMGDRNWDDLVAGLAGRALRRLR